MDSDVQTRVTPLVSLTGAREESACTAIGLINGVTQAPGTHAGALPTVCRPAQPGVSSST